MIVFQPAYRCRMLSPTEYSHEYQWNIKYSRLERGGHPWLLSCCVSASHTEWHLLSLCDRNHRLRLRLNTRWTLRTLWTRWRTWCSRSTPAKSVASPVHCVGICFITSLMGAVAKYYDEHVCVCVCVCLYVREDVSRTTRTIFTKLLCMLLMAVAGFSSVWRGDEIPRVRVTKSPG